MSRSATAQPGVQHRFERSRTLLAGLVRGREGSMDCVGNAQGHCGRDSEAREAPRSRVESGAESHGGARIEPVPRFPRCCPNRGLPWHYRGGLMNGYT